MGVGTCRTELGWSLVRALSHEKERLPQWALDVKRLSRPQRCSWSVPIGPIVGERSQFTWPLYGLPETEVRLAAAQGRS